MTIDPTDTITPFFASSSSAGIGSTTTVTITVSSTLNAGQQESNAGQQYTVGDVAAAAAGTGTLLLIALIVAIIIIASLRRRLREARKQVEEVNKENPAFRQQHSYNQSSAPAYGSPTNVPYNPGVNGYFPPQQQPKVSGDGQYSSAQQAYAQPPREMGDQGIRELATSGQLNEMDNDSKADVRL